MIETKTEAWTKVRKKVKAGIKAWIRLEITIQNIVGVRYNYIWWPHYCSKSYKKYEILLSELNKLTLKVKYNFYSFK